MKKAMVLKTLLILSFAVSIYAGAVIINGLNVSSDGNGNVKIQWTTGQETNVSQFILERSPNQRDWVVVQTFQPRGSNSNYSYTDYSAYKTADVTFYYQLVIKDVDGTTTTVASSSVNSRLSGIKQTWGMIKAMFR